VKVLVTDAEYNLTLGVIRSLGRRGVAVAAAAATRRAEGFLSRYCAERLVLPPARDGERFVGALAEAARTRRVDVVLPVGYDATIACSRGRDRIAAVARLAVADADAMDVAASKRQTLELAERIGVPIPRTYVSADGVAEFPVVVKESLGSGHVRYANDTRELAGAVGSDSVIQEYVRGRGYGYFALFDRGEEKAFFMHRRVREYPPTGGASTAAESVNDPALRELGSRLLRELRWHGVAMVEFKRDERDGRYKLMEINPKFWGSLDLAVAAGVDFPWLAVQLAVGATFETPDYRAGLRHQWVASDALRTIARPRDAAAFAADLLDPRVAKDVSLRDPKPNLLELAYTAVAAWRRARDGSLLYPHGRPRST
jgi:predicted ATP-grasp superfamily ATP-dependent carboligase